jgi:hypothetical protein
MGVSRLAMTKTMVRNITLQDAVDRYLEERREDVSDSALYNHSSQLKQFAEWCIDNDDNREKVAGIDKWSVSAQASNPRRSRKDAEPLCATTTVGRPNAAGCGSEKQ